MLAPINRIQVVTRILRGKKVIFNIKKVIF
jgi:hypothetical protein